MPFIEINAVNFYYKFYPNKNKATLVLISGYTSDHSMWAPLVPLLQNHYQLLVFDNQAIGQTIDQQQTLTINDMANHIFQLIQTLHLNDISLLGFAVGGTLAQHIAINYPQHIHALILLNSVAKWSDDTIAKVTHLYHLRKQQQYQAMFALLYDEVFSNKTKKQYSQQSFIEQQDIQQYKQKQSLADQARQLALFSNFDSRAELHKITAKTLILSSKEDTFGTVDDGNKLGTLIKNSQHIALDAGHAAVQEAPDSIAKHIKNFL